MQFLAQVKAIKADLAKKEITISFVVDMTQADTETAEELANFVGKDASDMALTITPRQIAMKLEKMQHA